MAVSSTPPCTVLDCSRGCTCICTAHAGHVKPNLPCSSMSCTKTINVFLSSKDCPCTLPNSGGLCCWSSLSPASALLQASSIQLPMYRAWLTRRLLPVSIRLGSW